MKSCATAVGHEALFVAVTNLYPQGISGGGFYQLHGHLYPFSAELGSCRDLLDAIFPSSRPISGNPPFLASPVGRPTGQVNISECLL